MDRRTFVRRTAGALAAGALPPALASCSDDPDEDGGITRPGPRGVVEIELRSGPFVFSPSSPRIEAGTTVRWVNASPDFHTVTPEGHDEFPRREFPADARGETFEHTFDSPGTFPYFCEPHRSLGMVGEIEVV